MCGINGIYCTDGKIGRNKKAYEEILEKMNLTIKHRGPDEQGIYLKNHCGLGHVRLSILDIKKGKQPMVYYQDGKEYAIVYNGEIYNMKEIQKELVKAGVTLDTNCDTEVILKGYALWGIDLVKKLNGIFAFGIWEEEKEQLILCRDPLGIKPLFYYYDRKEVIFSSEIKGILAYNPHLAKCDKKGLCELLSLGPAHTVGRTVYENIEEIKPATICIMGKEKKEEICYWKLEGKEHKDNKEQTIEAVSFLVEDAIEKQLQSDIPVCTFLSGGLDSSIVSAVAVQKEREKGRILTTYSFDFTDNEKYFLANSFQPSQDAPYAKEMVKYLGCNHRILWCDSHQLFDNLSLAMKARDYPCMADVESSLFYFCKKVSRDFKVAITGECADEIFGGYPWFYKKEMFERQEFPWSYDIETRECLLKEEMKYELKLKEYSHQAYESTIKETPEFIGDTLQEKRRRELMYLNIRWFMATLLERMDRTSMYHGLEARVPFADYRIVEYLYNVPWEFKFMEGREKGLLRYAAKKWLPDSVLFRKKSPYPKNYDPNYEKLLRKAFAKLLAEEEEPIHKIIDKKKGREFLENNLTYSKPWYGQLMAGPQLLAYYMQINQWMKEYEVEIIS